MLWREQMARQALAVKQDTEALQAATAVLSSAEEELQAFANDLTARWMLGERYHAALQVRVSAVNEAQAELRRVSASAPDAGIIERYADLPIQERKRILGSSIDAVIVKRGHKRVPIEERVTILWRGEGPEDLPRAGRDNGLVRPYLP
jgi:hypothetical protein